MILSSWRSTLIFWSSCSANYTQQSSSFSHWNSDCHIIVIFFSRSVVTWCSIRGNSSPTYSFHDFVNKRKRNARRILSFSNLTSDCFLGTCGVCSRLRETVHSSLYGSAMPGLLLCWQKSMPTVPPHRFSRVILENPLPIALNAWWPIRGSF